MSPVIFIRGWRVSKNYCLRRPKELFYPQETQGFRAPMVYLWAWQHWTSIKKCIFTYLGLEITLGPEWNYFHVGIIVTKENCECGEIVMKFSLFQGLRRSYKTPWLPRDICCFAPIWSYLLSQSVILIFFPMSTVLTDV